MNSSAFRLPRPLRLEYPGAFWHVYNRGVERRDIVLCDPDRRSFVDLLAATQRQFRWRIHAFVLMTNHYHLLIETPEPTLSRGMQKLDGDHAGWFNRVHRRVGPLWQGRFRAHLVDKESYLLELARYVVLNPVRAGMVASPGEWPWSSYRSTAGISAPPPWLETETILERFDPWDRTTAMSLYREFVMEGIGLGRNPWDELRSRLYLGSEAFMARVQELTAARPRVRTEPARQRNLRAIDIDAVREIVETELGTRIAPKKWSNESARLAFAALARDEVLATFTEIGRLLGLTAQGARGLTRRAERRARSEREFRCLVEGVRLRISQFKKRV